MIDQKYQKKGFGREAIALGLNFIKFFSLWQTRVSLVVIWIWRWSSL